MEPSEGDGPCGEGSSHFQWNLQKVMVHVAKVLLKISEVEKLYCVS